MRFFEQIIELFAANNSIHLTHEGLERMSAIAKDNKCAFFDSFAKLVAPLGLKESSYFCL